MRIQFKSLRSYSLLIFVILLLTACKKDVDQDNNNTVNETAPDLTSKVTSSVSGFITNENNNPIQGALITSGINSTISDVNGFFSFSNIELVKVAATVSISAPGYFKIIKTWTAQTGKPAFLRIKLLPKTVIGTFTASVGGNVSTTTGFNIIFPADAVKNAATATLYSGLVTVKAQWIDPTSVDLPNLMPGDLRGINSNGFLRMLITYGMAGVELAGSSGEVLAIADSKKATLNFPIPAALNATAPSASPIWYFDETKGLWIEEGIATKSGSVFTCEVGHFSFWNVDVPNANFVQFEVTVNDASGNPIPNARVTLRQQSNPNNFGSAYSNSLGFVSMPIPGNTQLNMTISSFNSCDIPFNQTIVTTNTNLSLGTVSLSTSIGSITAVSGAVVDCNGSPVTNGYVIFNANNSFNYYPLNSNGTYQFSYISCAPVNGVLVGVNNSSGINSVALPIVVTGNSLNLSAIEACNTNDSVYVIFSTNGSPLNYYYPVDSVRVGNSFSGGINYVTINAYRAPGGNDEVTFIFDRTNISVGSTHMLQNLLTPTLPPGSYQILTPTFVNITELGATGEYLSGIFSGQVQSTTAPNPMINISGAFRVRRTF